MTLPGFLLNLIFLLFTPNTISEYLEYQCLISLYRKDTIFCKRQQLRSQAASNVNAIESVFTRPFYLFRRAKLARRDTINNIGFTTVPDLRLVFICVSNKIFLPPPSVSGTQLPVQSIYLLSLTCLSRLLRSLRYRGGGRGFQRSLCFKFQPFSLIYHRFPMFQPSFISKPSISFTMRSTK